MTCQECELLLAAGNSPPDHLTTCAACRELAEDLRANTEALHAMLDVDVGQDFILQPAFSRPVRVSLLAAAAALVIAAIALTQLRQPAPVERPHVAVAVTPPKFELRT